MQTSRGLLSPSGDFTSPGEIGAFHAKRNSRFSSEAALRGLSDSPRLRGSSCYRFCSTNHSCQLTAPRVEASWPFPNPSRSSRLSCLVQTPRKPAEDPEAVCRRRQRRGSSNSTLRRHRRVGVMSADALEAPVASARSRLRTCRASKPQRRARIPATPSPDRCGPSPRNRA